MVYTTGVMMNDTKTTRKGETMFIIDVASENDQTNRLQWSYRELTDAARFAISQLPGSIVIISRETTDEDEPYIFDSRCPWHTRDDLEKLANGEVTELP